MQLEVTYPGKKKVAAQINGVTVVTDQPVDAGGEAAGPSPFDCFVVSIGTCAGYYVLAFCQERNIPTEQIKLVQTYDRDPDTHLIPKITLEIRVPEDFPEKYKKVVIRAAEQCTVKKHLQEPPDVAISVTQG